jgi:hypothetical protein
MNLAISENTDIRTVQTLIDEALALGLRVIYRPEPKPNNVVILNSAMEKRRMQMCVSAEA